MNVTLRKTSKLFCLILSISMISAGLFPVHGVIPAPPPFPAARWMAMVQVAVFEAVNAVTGKYQPYLGTVTAPPGASADAAAVMASYTTLVTLFPAQSGLLDQRRDASLAQIPAGQAKTDGSAVGIAAANAVLADRANDGSAPATFYLPTTSNPYEWQVYAGCPAGGGAFFNWKNIKPFSILGSSQFRALPPPLLGSEIYNRDLKETKTYGGVNSASRPQDRTDVARLYAAANPPALWNGILLQLVSSRNDEITDTARTMAIMNMAVSDAAVSVFETKYWYKTWRPLTAIPYADAGTRGMPVTTFNPLIATPCFPSYPSAHGTLSSAAIEVLEKTYGRFGRIITVQQASVPGVVLQYSDIRDILKDISDARVFGGIHFRFDQVAGEQQGTAVADYVMDHTLLLRPRGR